MIAESSTSPVVGGDVEDGETRPWNEPRFVYVEGLAVGLIVGLIYALLAGDAVAQLGRLYDDVIYVTLGKALASGEGYRSIYLVGDPVHVKFPPLLPAIYAVVWKATGNFEGVARAATALNVVATAASAFLLWVLARRVVGLGRLSTATLVMLPLLCSRTMHYFTGAASEPWMLMGWAGALLLGEHMRRIRREGGEAMGSAIVLGLILAASALARSHAMVVALGVLVVLPFVRVGSRAAAAAVAATVVPLATWKVAHARMVSIGPVSTLPDQLPYTAWIPHGSLGEAVIFSLRIMSHHIPEYARQVPNLLVGWESPRTYALAAAFMGLAAVGLVLLLRRQPALVLTTLGMLGLVAIWSGYQDRYLTPIFPMLGIGAAAAVEWTVRRFPRLVRAGVAVGGALLALYVLRINVASRQEVVRDPHETPFGRATAAIASWIEQNTTPDERILTDRGAGFYLRTGRKTSIQTPEEPVLGPSVWDAPHRFLATRLVEDSVDVVVIWTLYHTRAEPVLREMGSTCPGLVRQLEPARTPGVAQTIHYYRIDRTRPCLREIAGL